ncbi:uncharacterized protein BO97DRAFT_463410 [Aspergillus homomorphus CBS 101889]|uniref:Jacalin-type lectin domain-containing protein n=1 Tax=Aspergillus homomorphus (strain CBS 101889) TaxID=1450537 RepID=A0A395HN34_ASPHC|nr:hypothetical protein BO97DRAFT_463410 [Aspergillus homomorphus CBS 101889]RAL07684.1 hypothetical protein BO97DRAFT_463410 [Aspergillus homomorphus CBS 101889]
MAKGIVGNGTIGGNGGNHFWETKYDKGAMVEEIIVWKEGNILRGLKLSWTDGSDSTMIGKSSGSSQSFTFKVKEKCTEMVLRGNGIGTRCGHIEFKTDQGNSFSWGDGGSDNYYMDVGSGFLVGFQGRANLDIDSLGPLFLKPLKSVHSEVDYGDFPNGAPDPTHITLDTQDFDGNHEYEWDFHGSKTKTTTSTWSQTLASSFDLQVKVKAGVPELAEVESTIKWGLSASSTHSQAEQDSSEIGWDVHSTVSPGQTVHCEAYCFQGTSDVDYTSTVTVTFQSGETLQFKESGTFSGVTYSEAKTTVNYTPP